MAARVDLSTTSATMGTASTGGRRPRAGALFATWRRHEPAPPDLVVCRRDEGRKLYEGGPQHDAEGRKLDEQQEQQRNVDHRQQRRDPPRDGDRPEDPFVEGKDRGIAPISVLGNVVNHNRSDQQEQARDPHQRKEIRVASEGIEQERHWAAESSGPRIGSGPRPYSLGRWPGRQP